MSDDVLVDTDDGQVVLRVNDADPVYMDREIASRIAVSILRAANELYFEEDQ